MGIELFNLGGYGYYVWPAFMFTIVSCFYLYLRTKTELKKSEKMFSSEFSKLNLTKIKVAKHRESAEKVLSGNSIF